MSLTKRIWIDRDPAYENVRGAYMADVQAAIAASPFRVSTRRKNRLNSSRHWDPLWPGCVRDAAKELGADYMPVNWQFLFRSAELRDQVVARAEQLWVERLELHRPNASPKRDELNRRIASVPLPRPPR